MVRDQRRVRDVRDDELVLQPFGIGEAERLAVGLDLVALRAQPVRPELERLGRGDAPDDGVDHPVARLAGLRVRVLEERDVGARVPLFVGVEEVVDGRVVLVDRLLHEPQAEDARVEVDVPRRVAGDARDVVDPVETHLAQPCASASSSFAASRSAAPHDDLARARRHEVLERGVDRVGVPVRALDPHRPEQCRRPPRPRIPRTRPLRRLHRLPPQSEGYSCGVVPVMPNVDPVVLRGHGAPRRSRHPRRSPPPARAHGWRRRALGFAARARRPRPSSAPRG